MPRSELKARDIEDSAKFLLWDNMHIWKQPMSNYDNQQEL